LRSVSSIPTCALTEEAVKDNPMDEAIRKLKTVGKCVFCGREMAKSGMTRHLSTCKAREVKNTEAQGKPVKLYHLAINDSFTPYYWLHVELPASTHLRTLDRFLRDIWLECCGHLSQFIINDKYYMLDEALEFVSFAEQGMKIALSKVVKPGAEFRYEYDFGTTSELNLKVIAERTGIPHDKGVFMMSRNEPPKIMCEVCNQHLATKFYTMSDYDEPIWYCDTCAKNLEDDEEAYFLPVVNSPRVGMCGYTGELE
jgi:hypothetical protein